MNLATVTAIADVLPSLATLTTGATKTARGGRALKMYRPEAAPAELTAECKEALTALVKSGATVRVYSLASIYTLALTPAGELSWDNVKATNTAYRPALIVKVAL